VTLRRLARRPVARRVLPWAVVAGVVLALAAAAIALGSPLAARVRWQAGAAGDTGSAEPVGPPPTRLRIPTIGVDAPLVDLRLDDKGALGAPQDFATPGWYADGTRPGDVGPAIIAGHVDSKTGPAVFFRLHELRADQTIEVARGDGWVKFRVLAVRRYAKDQFPTDEVYAPTPNAQLRLITCGGAFDNTRRSYVDNVVVYAVAI
jgi:sortase (surface protein transpeptidase)